MTVKINSTMKQKEIQEIFDGKEFKGVTLHFQKKQGMALIFDTEGADGMTKDEVKAIVKGQCKAEPSLKALMIIVDVL